MSAKDCHGLAKPAHFGASRFQREEIELEGKILRLGFRQKCRGLIKKPLALFPQNVRIHFKNPEVLNEGSYIGVQTRGSAVFGLGVPTLTYSAGLPDTRHPKMFNVPSAKQH